MNWARAVKGKGTRVFRGSVALMILETEGGVKRGEFGHGAIARDLGDDGGGGDGRAAGVAIDDGDFPAGDARLLVAIDEAEVGLQAQALHRAAHGKEARAKNIVRLDFVGRRDSDGPMHLRMFAEEVVQLRARLGDEHLRIVQVPMLQPIRQNRRRRIDRPRPAPATDFIHARDDSHAFRTKRPLKCPAKGVAAFAGRHGFKNSQNVAAVYDGS
jgi:hypothetical protein